MSKIISSPAVRAVKDKRSGALQARSCTAVVGNSSLVAPNVKTRAYKNQVKAALSSASAGSAPNSAVNKPAPASQDALKSAAPEVRIVADDHGLRVVGADVDTTRSSSLSHLPQKMRLRIRPARPLRLKPRLQTLLQLQVLLQ